jgi:hypothetical protein
MMLSKIPAISFICTVLLSSVSFGAEVELKGKMFCTIKDVTARAMEDGKPKVYSGMKGRKKVGDTFSLEYSLVIKKRTWSRSYLTRPGAIEVIFIKFLFPRNFKAKGFSGKDEYFDIEDIFDLGPEYNWISSNHDSVLSVSERQGPSLKTMEMRKDQFYIGSKLALQGYNFRRYYKDDWEGHFVDTSYMVVYTYNFECKHTTKDVWSDIFFTSKEYIKKNYDIDPRGISSMKKDLQ